MMDRQQRAIDLICLLVLIQCFLLITSDPVELLGYVIWTELLDYVIWMGLMVLLYEADFWKSQ